jgi:hypothetical protein
LILTYTELAYNEICLHAIVIDFFSAMTHRHPAQ